MDSLSIDYGKLAEHVAAFSPFIVLVAGIIGLGMVAIGLFNLARLNSGNSARGGAGSALITILIGGAMLSVVGLMDMGANTWGSIEQDQREILYEGGVPDQDLGIEGNEPLQAGMNLLVVVAWVLGMLGFIRGLMMLNAMAKGGQQQGHSVGHAASFIIGGLASMNLMFTLSLFTYTVFQMSFAQFMQTVT